MHFAILPIGHPPDLCHERTNYAKSFSLEVLLSNVATLVAHIPSKEREMVSLSIGVFCED